MGWSSGFVCLFTWCSCCRGFLTLASVRPLLTTVAGPYCLVTRFGCNLMMVWLVAVWHSVSLPSAWSACSFQSISSNWQSWGALCKFHCQQFPSPLGSPEKLTELWEMLFVSPVPYQCFKNSRVTVCIVSLDVLISPLEKEKHIIGLTSLSFSFPVSFRAEVVQWKESPCLRCHSHGERSTLYPLIVTRRDFAG